MYGGLACVGEVAECARLGQVTEGSGRMLVVAVGAESEWGRTMALVATEAQPTPLQVPRLPCPAPCLELAAFPQSSMWLSFSLCWHMQQAPSTACLMPCGCAGCAECLGDSHWEDWSHCGRGLLCCSFCQVGPTSLFSNCPFILHVDMGQNYE